MDVSRYVEKVLVSLNKLSLESSLKYCSDAFILFIKVHGKSSVESMHESINRFLAFLVKEKVDMIWHEAICQERDIVLAKVFFESFQVARIVFMIKENCLFIMASIINVVIGIWLKRDNSLVHNFRLAL